MTQHGNGFVIVGGGLAAVRSAQNLREEGYSGSLTILSGDTRPPYSRPPLSKQALTGGLTPELLDLMPEGDYAERGIDLRLGSQVVAIDLAGHRVTLADQSAVGYERLIVATGSRPRKLADLAGLPQVRYLRTIEDAQQLRASLESATRVAIVGAGFIGLEVSSAARRLGCTVTVLEAARRPVERALGSEIADWLVARHRADGVDIRTGVQVQPHPNGIDLLINATEKLGADLIVVGVGIDRELDWLTRAGLQTHVGLVVDADGQTSHPDVFGAGDVTCIHDEQLCVPVQHWFAAASSAVRAARSAVGLSNAGDPIDTTFWTEQAGIRLQSAGAWDSSGRLHPITGGLDEDSFVVECRVGAQPRAVVGVNDPRSFVRARRALREQSATQ